MTPDEVVTRAREFEGREVLLTIRGKVSSGAYHWHLMDESGKVTTVGPKWEPTPGLVDIQPAPMRIEAGQLYADAVGDLFRGTPDGLLWGFGDGYRQHADGLAGLRRVKVVDA